MTVWDIFNRLIYFWKRILTNYLKEKVLKLTYYLKKCSHFYREFCSQMN